MASIDHPVLTPTQLQEVLDASFAATTQRVLKVTARGVVTSLEVDERNVRPGGTVSGPTVMSVADSAAWLAVMSRIGPVVLAVTTSLHIDFLRKPALTNLIARADLLKLGRRLAVSEVAVYSEGMSEPVAKAQVTYSIPPAP